MIRLAIRCRTEDAELLLAELLELAPGGVEEEHGDGWAEFAIYGPPGEIPEIGELEASSGVGLIEVSSTVIPDDWADRWRDFHRPVVVSGGRLVVMPSWETAPGGEAASTGGEAAAPGLAVLIDPGQAFGTGAHATTRMCLELMLELADEGAARGPLCDLGTGSGVLAIAAARLGWAPVTGCDSEQASIEAAGENALANGVRIELRRINLRRERAPSAPTVLANLTAPLLEEVASGLAAAPPERLVCSGLLVAEADRVTEAFARAGLQPRSTRSSGDWAAICFAPSGPSGPLPTARETR